MLIEAINRLKEHHIFLAYLYKENLNIDTMTNIAAEANKRLPNLCNIEVKLAFSQPDGQQVVVTSRFVCRDGNFEDLSIERKKNNSSFFDDDIVSGLS